MSLERSICEFTPYEVGKMTALNHSLEQFQDCNTVMRDLSRRDPKIDRFLVALENGEGKETLLEVDKRLIFACYLVSQEAYHALVDIGEKDVADAVVSLHEEVAKAA